MINLMQGILSASTQAVSSNSKENEYRAIVRSIRMTSKLISFFLVLGISLAIGLFIIILTDRAALLYSPGRWDRQLYYVNAFFHCVAVPGLLFSSFLYLHPRLTSLSKRNHINNVKSNKVDHDGHVNNLEITTVVNKTPEPGAVDVRLSNQYDVSSQHGTSNVQ